MGFTSPKDLGFNANLEKMLARNVLRQRHRLRFLNYGALGPLRMDGSMTDANLRIRPNIFQSTEKTVVGRGVTSNYHNETI
jgi:hypothetical protein